MTQKKATIIWIIVLILVGGGSYYLGTKHGSSGSTAGAASAYAGRTGGGAGRFGGGAGAAGAAAGGGFTTGSIVSATSDSLTIQLPGTAGSKVVFFSNTTGIMKTVSGSANDLTPGTMVMVSGSANSDGSLTAQTIQIRPATTTQVTAQ